MGLWAGADFLSVIDLDGTGRPMCDCVCVYARECELLSVDE
jgi:hypothetical protein